MLRPLALILALALAPLASIAVHAAERELTPVDRVVALVDEEPILLSDLERVIGLGLVVRQPGESDDSLRRRTLDRLIELALRQAELGRFGFQQLPVEEVDLQFDAVRGRFESDQAFQAELDRLGLDEQGVRQLIARQLSTLSFVEERLGPRIFVGIEEIRRYYEETLVPELAAAGQPAPPIEEVRESIRAVLREQKLDEEIVRWTDELRRAADIVDLLDAPDRALPPVVDSWDAPAEP
jgi:hypothetical protein